MKENEFILLKFTQMKRQYKIITLATTTALISACGGSSGGDDVTHSQNIARGYSRYKAASVQDKERAQGQGVYVGLVDTGIDLNSKGLANRKHNISKYVIKDNTKEISRDDHGHGTLMVELILETAPSASINSAINSGKDGVYSISGLTNLLRANQVGVKVDIVNNSYGVDVKSNEPSEVYGTAPDYTKIRNHDEIKLFKEFIDRGALVIISTGNEDKLLAQRLAAAPLVDSELKDSFIAVTSLNRQTDQKDRNACGELAKDWCLTAPENFIGAYGLNNNKMLVPGTSAATAYVGLAAKIKSRYDWFTGKDLAQTLFTTTHNKGRKSNDKVWGRGLINENSAMNGYGSFEKDVILNVEGKKDIYYFDNDISGKGSLTKSGSKVLVMNGNNTYRGSTLVEKGELVANGNSNSYHIVSKGAKLTIGDSAESIWLDAVQNKGELFVEDANLTVRRDFDSQNGTVNQAIGTQIQITGSANLKDSSWVLTGVKDGYVTKEGEKEVLLTANGGITNHSNFKFSYKNGIYSDLVSQTESFDGDTLSVITKRDSLDKVVHNRHNFTGKDNTVDSLDGLLDRLDVAKLPTNITFHYKKTSKASPLMGLGIANALLYSKNLNQTVFGMNTATAQHAQLHLVNEKVLRSEKAIDHALSAEQSGAIWMDTGFGKTTAKALSSVNGESQDNSQTVGLAKSFSNRQHRLAVQLSRVDYGWTESYQGLKKALNTHGYGFEAAYAYAPTLNSYWVSGLVGFDRLKATSTYGADAGGQLVVGSAVGK